MKIIPAIDLIDGKCVRLTQGDFSTAKTYNENPLEVAKMFESVGVKHLHLIDLDGARAGKIVNASVLEQIASQTELNIDFGGGLRTSEDVKIAFESGANQITGGSIAVQNPEVLLAWTAAYGTERIILGADCSNGRIAVNGWQETASVSLFDFIDNWSEKGLRQVICTDISKDGAMNGPAFELYTQILKHFEVQLIASGGISSIPDVIQLEEIGCSGAIIGKAIYEGAISLNQIRELC